MSKLSKRGLLKDVDPTDVVVLLKTAGKILNDLRKKILMPRNEIYPLDKDCILTFDGMTN